MTTGQDVVDAATEWIGTPFHHQGRVIGMGVDCAGLIVGVAHGLGLSAYDVKGYPRVPDGASLERILESQLQKIDRPQAEPGDVLLFGFHRFAQHLAIISRLDPVYIIHAYEQNGKVIHHRLDDVWARRIRAVYRLPGVVNG